MTRSLTLAALIALVITAGGLTQSSSASRPEDVIRSLLKAIYSNDVTAYESLTVPDPRRSRMVSGGRVNEAALRELEEDPSALQIKMKRPFKHRGLAVEPDGKGDYPVGTTSLYLAAHRGNPTVIRLEKRQEGWKVDLRWWLAMMEMASSKGPQRGTADYSARALIAALVALDRKRAAQFAVPDANLELLFAWAPSQREPSGHLDALVLEMPIVELSPGEFCDMPSGRVLEGSQREGTKLLLGILGSVEIPFVVRRVGGEWRVEVEPYFPLIMR